MFAIANTYLNNDLGPGVKPQDDKEKKRKIKGDIMKNVLVVSLMLLMPYVANALDMCVRDSAMVVSLDPAVGGSSYKSNASEMTWSVTFSYGTIYGEATCLSGADGKPSGDMGVYTNDRGEMLANDDSLVQQKVGSYCWCRMTHPALSRWVFGYSISASHCFNGCASYCADNVSLTGVLRKGLFGSVGK